MRGNKAERWMESKPKSWVIEEKQEGCERSGGLWWAPELARWPRKVRSTKWTARKGGLSYREEQDEADGGRRRWRLQVFVCSSMQCSCKRGRRSSRLGVQWGKNSRLVIVFVCLAVDNMWEDQQWSAMNTSTPAHHCIVTSSIYERFHEHKFLM